MTLYKLSFCAIALSFLIGCGGGTTTVSSAQIKDTIPPAITQVSTGTPIANKATLYATASDNTEVSGYCFKTTSSIPLASDGCFTADATKVIDKPTATSPTYFVWAKDAENNVSATFIADSTAPAVTSVVTSAPSIGNVTLNVTATDAKGITGYCFTTTATVPPASDSCFKPAAITSILTPTSPVRYYTFVKDAANNVSAAYERVIGPCSATGIAASQASALPTVCVSTSQGEFVLALESTKAPITTTNFLRYVNDGFYSQTVFHRVISTFMIQGGGYTAFPIGSATEKAGTLYSPIQLETTTVTGLSNTTGTIAMARTGVLNSATREFFINVVDNIALNTSSGGYAVFGRVISGLDPTVQAIRAVQVKDNGGGEVSQPLTPPVINWAYQVK
jgi:cyclophilin family peptidyl-prolyl cis-trans isomerase